MYEKYTPDYPIILQTFQTFVNNKIQLSLICFDNKKNNKNNGRISKNGSSNIGNNNNKSDTDNKYKKYNKIHL